MVRKPDARAIEDFLQSLRVQFPRGNRKTWPYYVFHHTPLENAVSILREGVVLSRELATARRGGFRDIAHQGVVTRTEKAHRYARLYFRPRTPTQYHQEGIRVVARENTAHCPIPYFFLFRSEDVWCRAGVEFSNGNMQASRADTGDGITFLRSLDFRAIYHDAPLREDEKKQKVHAMCSEVLVPNQLPLVDGLEAVVCRTGAERATLLDQVIRDFLLGTPDPTGREALLLWGDYIRVEAPDENLFFRRQTYIEDVKLLAGALSVTVHEGYGTHEYIVRARCNTKERVASARLGTAGGDGKRQITVPLATQPTYARVSITVNDHLAFAALVTRQDLF